MQYALAVPTQNGGSRAGGGGVRRISIHADSASVDLVLSAAVPIGSLIPPIVDVLHRRADFRPGPVAVRYQLSIPASTVLDASKTLAQLGIRDGTVLLLTRSSTELMAPRFDEAAEAVSASVAALVRRWTQRVSRLAGSLTAMWLAAVTAAILIRTAFCANDTHRTAGVGVAATITLLTLPAAAIAYRGFQEKSGGLVLGLLATGFAALAGLLAVPGGPGAPNMLFAAAAAAASAAIMRVIAGCSMAFDALLIFSVTGAAAASVGAITAIPWAAIGAAFAAMSLAVIEASAPVSIMLARLSALTADPTADTSFTDPHRLNTKAIRAHTWLTTLITAFSASAALGAGGTALGSCLSGGPRSPGLVFAALTGSVLLLRARAHRDPARSAPLFISGTAILSAGLVAASVAYPKHTPHIAAVSISLSAVALCLGFVDDRAVGSPIARRALELLEYFAFATIAPLAFWLCGLYGAARSLNLS
ncbi:type VII secretion integral membrane protein EccD [Mycobacterium sp.]|uniref:type VII secretion integral membrane protein EccD n=1 Tax=Mycobacterium sp. TaxID=1785 RepID=UPI003BB18FE0